MTFLIDEKLFFRRRQGLPTYYDVIKNTLISVHEFWVVIKQIVFCSWFCHGTTVTYSLKCNVPGQES